MQIYIYVYIYAYLHMIYHVKVIHENSCGIEYHRQDLSRLKPHVYSNTRGFDVDIEICIYIWT